MKKILFIIFAAFFAIAGCSDLNGGNSNNSNNSGDNNGNGGNTGSQTGVSINVNTSTVTLDLETNTSFKLDAFTADSNGSNVGGVTYASDNSQIASVTSDGTITAVAKGYTFITITSQTDSSLTASVEVIVNEKAGDTGTTYEIIVNKDSITLTNGNSETLSSKLSISYKPALTPDMVLSAVPADKNLLTTAREGSDIKLIPKGVGTTSLKLTVSSIQPDKNDFGYITIPVYIKEAGVPDPIIYPDINPSEVDTYKNRMYFKIKFDAFSSTGDLYNSSNYSGINAVVFDSKLCGNGQTCSGDLINKGNGHINPFGFCEKYGCTQNGQSYDNGRIAEKNVGITYYAGNNKLYVPVSTTGGTQNYVIYIVLETLPGNHYSRENISFPINWDDYNPVIHKILQNIPLHTEIKSQL